LFNHMEHSWKRIVDLIKRTGERCLVLNEADSEVYAIMRLDDYEKLTIKKNEVIDLTEDELLDRINSDIALWQSNQSSDAPFDVVPGDSNKEDDEEEEFYIEPVGTSD